MRVVAAAAFGALVDVAGPGRAMPGVVGKAGDGGAQAVIAGPAEDDAAALAGLVGDGADAGLSGELVLGLEALAYVTEFGQDLGGADATGAREGGYDFAIGQFADGVFDARGQLGDLSDQRGEDGGPGAHEFALGIGFAVAGQTGRCAPQARQQLAGASSAAIAMLRHEGFDALLAQPCSAVRRGIALHEGKCDRAVDVGEDRHSAGPEAVEQGAQLVGKHEALRHQRIAAADQGTQRLDLVGAGHEPAKAVAVGTQQIGQEVGIAAVTLAAGGAIARPAGLDDIGMDGHDRMAGRYQRVDDQTVWSLDRDRQIGRWREPRQASHQIGNTDRIVRHWESRDDFADVVLNDTDPVLGTAPIKTPSIGHVTFPRGWTRVSLAGRSCGLLIDRRSGFGNLALHPVARRNLPAPSARRVSCGPSSGKPDGPSRKTPGREYITAYAVMYSQAKVHQ